MFDEIFGQAPAVETLEHALRAGRLHHAYRFEGPPGVGKERTALALAKHLLCERGGCGECPTCRRVVTYATEAPEVPQHPDVVLVGRQLYPKHIVSKPETTGISVEQIRKVVLARAGYPPHEGRALLFIVRDADELTHSAANALLKTLEEPGAAVHFILLTSRPHRLLDTVRSRTLAVRFRALSDDVVAKILSAHGKDPSLALRAQGSASAALELADADDTDVLSSFAKDVAAALADPGIATALALAGSLPSDKLELRKRLLGYGHHLGLQLRDSVQRRDGEDLRLTRFYSAVNRALSALERNTAGTLAVEAMLVEMRNAR